MKGGEDGESEFLEKKMGGLARCCIAGWPNIT
jgi:hypothetical protein